MALGKTQVEADLGPHYPGEYRACALMGKYVLANMFSHMVGSLFILLMFSLAMQKLFNLMKSHLFILSFMSLALGDILVKILLHGISEIFLPLFI